MKTVRTLVALGAVLLLSRPAFAEPQAFAPGSLIIPMDIDSQDVGMLRAFGLVYKLLLADVPVTWSILPGKSLYTGSTKNPASPGSSVDFTATAKDVRTGASVGTHGYRGGPFIIGAGDKARALTIITAWNNGQTNLVTVHEATAGFTAPVDRVMLNAPNIGINADGNEAIAYGYLNAAGIPDSTGKAWSGTSPDVMTPAQVAGPTTSSHRDGKLWGPTGQPRYCQLMSMHWTVSRDTTSNEAIAEMSEYLLHYPVHLFAECQAVNQLEDAPAGHFVSTDNGTGTPTKSVACDTTTTPNNGLCAKKPTPAPPLEFLNSDLAFAQMDGPFKPVGGSEPSYGLAPGSSYYDQGIVMIREANVANGMNGRSDLWMTGYANLAGDVCQIGESSLGCVSRGKVSYLGGHQYGTAVPISTNGDTQGTRLFLNSLFEAACVTADGSPSVSVGLGGPTSTTTPLVTYTFDWTNIGAGVAVTARLVDTLPAGASFVSATAGGVFAGGQVTWTLGDLAADARGSVSVTVALSAYGSYQNSGTVTYKAGNNVRTNVSNTLTTAYGPTMPGGSGGSGGGALCTGVSCPGPTPANPCQVGACNPADGTCGFSHVADGTPCDDGNACTAGTTCTAGSCGGGVALQCGQPANPCQVAACVPASGCVVSDAANGTPCASGNKCALDETCTGGTCGGGATRICPAPASPCEVETCDPASGCGFAPGHEGATCDDGDVCTTGTTCRSGLCQAGAGCAAPSQPCTLALCGTTGCLTGFAAAGTDPRGDCPAIGACARSCNGSGSCTSCLGGMGSGAGGGGASGAGGASDGLGGAGGVSGLGAGGDAAGGGGHPAGGSSGGLSGNLDGGVADGGGAIGGKGGSGALDGGSASDGAPADHSATGTASSGGCNCSTAEASSAPLSSATLAIGFVLALGAARRRRPAWTRALSAHARSGGGAGDRRA